MTSRPDSENSDTSPKQNTEQLPLARPIPWRWVVIAILGYMLIHNVILWLNTR